MARRPNRGNAEALREEDLKDLPAHFTPVAVRDYYERSYRDCRRLYDHLPTLKQMRTLVQAWKQLWKCR